MRNMLIRKEWRLLLLDRPIEAMQSMRYRTGYSFRTVREFMLEGYAHILVRYVRRLRTSGLRSEALHFLGRLAKVLGHIDSPNFTNRILEYLHIQAA